MEAEQDTKAEISLGFDAYIRALFSIVLSQQSDYKTHIFPPALQHYSCDLRIKVAVECA